MLSHKVCCMLSLRKRANSRINYLKPYLFRALFSCFLSCSRNHSFIFHFMKRFAKCIPDTAAPTEPTFVSVKYAVARTASLACTICANSTEKVLMVVKPPQNPEPKSSLLRGVSAALVDAAIAPRRNEPATFTPNVVHGRARTFIEANASYDANRATPPKAQPAPTAAASAQSSLLRRIISNIIYIYVK